MKNVWAPLSVLMVPAPSPRLQDAEIFGTLFLTVWRLWAWEPRTPGDGLAWLVKPAIRALLVPRPFRKVENDCKKSEIQPL